VTEEAPASTIVIVGLGNPGEEYAGTRHNIGQMVIEELAHRTSSTLAANKKVYARAATAQLAGQRVVLAVPMSYMNLSGGPVSALARYHSVPAENVVVVHDELDIDFGALKLKRGGGSGGHNGLKDISKALTTPDYVRVRVGIGRPPGRMDAAAYVLKPFSSTERKELPMVISDAADAVEELLAGGLEVAQRRFHRRS
jgi:PTH1 family peptidyl-tRNA hydrolase